MSLFSQIQNSLLCPRRQEDQQNYGLFPQFGIFWTGSLTQIDQNWLSLTLILILKNFTSHETYQICIIMGSP